MLEMYLMTGKSVAVKQLCDQLLTVCRCDRVGLPAKFGLTSHGKLHLRIEFVPN